MLQADKPDPRPSPVNDSRLRARIGAYALHATHDSRELTANARAAFMARFYNQVDPAGLLPPGERERRAAYARKQYFQALALKSAKARRRPRDAA